jgi:hypothetical protein
MLRTVREEPQNERHLKNRFENKGGRNVYWDSQFVYSTNIGEKGAREIS